MGLGKYPTVPLKLARERAAEYRGMAYSGSDPREKRDFQRKGSITFTECAAEYIHKESSSWSSRKHHQQWQNTLSAYAFPIFGNKPVNQINDEDVQRALKPIWLQKQETAKRVRGRIEAILDYAAVLKYRDPLNPARWKGHLQRVLPKVPRAVGGNHLPAMPYEDLPGFVRNLCRKETSSSRALQFMILTATRSNEVLEAAWKEIDLEERVWTIPAHRYKTRVELSIPLSVKALDLLAQTPRSESSPYIFMGGKYRKPLSNGAMLSLMQGMGYSKEGTKGHYVPHGFRSSFKDWVLEETVFQNEVSEMCLGHKVDNKTEAAYRRGNLLRKRVELMSAWSDYLVSQSK